MGIISTDSLAKYERDKEENGNKSEQSLTHVDGLAILANDALDKAATCGRSRLYFMGDCLSSRNLQGNQLPYMQGAL